ncbi:Ankyrin repeat-containing protein [Artemisia annua]|uniref:Ankyrin repeat-containing protein n=1 Tax=Artemisia annua TaxID=35608 RepID=A0A2U1KGL6_ARTAN|nr:Ankyrin repeat-containing protein [Artemisia annua]
MTAAKVILGKRPELIRFSITESYETVLHIAVLGESPELVDYLVSIMSKDDLEIPNINGATALHIAAITGNTEIATILIRENNNLLDIPDHDGKTPIDIAALCRKRDMVDLLYKESQQMTGEFWTNENRGLVLIKCVEANLFNVALQMVTKHPVLATNGSVLRLLARIPHDFLVLSPVFRICPWKIQFPHKESDSDALQLLRFILKDIGKLPKNELVAILKGPPDETKEDEKKTPYEKETQEALHLLRTISENIAKMPAQIYSLFQNSANNKTPPLNEGNRKYSSRVLFIAAEIVNCKHSFSNTLHTMKHFLKSKYGGKQPDDNPHLVWELNDNS